MWGTSWMTLSMLHNQNIIFFWLFHFLWDLSSYASLIASIKFGVVATRGHIPQSEQLTNEYILYMGLSDYLNMCLYIPFCRLEVRTMASDDSMEVSTHKAL